MADFLREGVFLPREIVTEYILGDGDILLSRSGNGLVEASYICLICMANVLMLDIWCGSYQTPMSYPDFSSYSLRQESLMHSCD